MAVCSNCGQDNPDIARFCLACATRLVPESPGREQRKTVSIVFADLTGSTEIGERLDPESLRMVMSRYFAEMRVALERHGGTVEKFIGDAVMAVFGIPSLREDDALRAVRAAHEMRDRLGTLNDELELRWGIRLRARIGVNTGEVVAGDPTLGQAFATGDAVNVAARLEQAAAAQEILIGDTTERLVRGAVRVEELALLTLKGKSERVRAFRLLSISADDVGAARDVSSPLVGRASELAILDDVVSSAIADRTSRLVTILGDAGVGKSRLVHTFASGLSGRATVVSGRCLPYGDGITFWPLAEVVRSIAGIAEQFDAERGVAKLGAALAGAPDADGAVQSLSAAIGMGDESTDPATILWAVRLLFAVEADRRPLIVVFDDVHWAEPTFLDLVEGLANPTSAPLVVMCLARPDLPEGRFPVRGAHATLSLDPLSDEQSAHLLTELLNGSDVAPEIASRVGPVAGGNPLFLEELVHKLIDDGVLRRDAEGWQRAGEFATSTVPPTIKALLATRLERLGEAERALIERASVMGEEFWPGVVARFPPEIPPAVLSTALERLVAKDLLRSGGRHFAGEVGYRFPHLLLRDVAYDGLLKATRADFHKHVADWLEDTAGDRVGEYREIVGHHLERSLRCREQLGPLDSAGRELARRAADHLSGAGRRALARGDMPAAVNLLERALALVDAEDPARRALSLQLGIALAETGQIARAEALMEERIEAERRERVYLTYRDGAGRQQVFDLAGRGPRVTIGRRAANDLSLAWDGDVSRVHAALEEEGGRWYLVDEGLSRNGSHLNGRRISGRNGLRDGDVLRFGSTVMVHHAPATVDVSLSEIDESRVTRLGQSSSASIELSPAERAVLIAVARRHDTAAAPVEELAAEVGLSSGDVARSLEALVRFFAVDGETGRRQRELMVERALAARLIGREELQ